MLFMGSKVISTSNRRGGASGRASPAASPGGHQPRTVCCCRQSQLGRSRLSFAAASPIQWAGDSSRQPRLASAALGCRARERSGFPMGKAVEYHAPPAFRFSGWPWAKSPPRTAAHPRRASPVPGADLQPHTWACRRTFHSCAHLPRSAPIYPPDRASIGARQATGSYNPCVCEPGTCGTPPGWACRHHVDPTGRVSNFRKVMSTTGARRW
jgi:hypothetical protein